MFPRWTAAPLDPVFEFEWAECDHATAPRAIASSEEAIVAGKESIRIQTLEFGEQYRISGTETPGGLTHLVERRGGRHEARRSYNARKGENFLHRQNVKRQPVLPLPRQRRERA
jgi:hypothetical protein